MKKSWSSSSNRFLIEVRRQRVVDAGQIIQAHRKYRLHWPRAFPETGQSGQREAFHGEWRRTVSLALHLTFRNFSAPMPDRGWGMLSLWPQAFQFDPL